ncbi:quinone-dependent dihydroorotate dehydrogenase [bacterium]|nr:quinone-dependent dihydroorotate dehydrogenase [bacterium]
MVYRSLIRPILFQFDSETIHDFVLRRIISHHRLARAVSPFFTFRHPGLEQTIFDLTFPNPVGLAAGFDKMATGIPAWPSLGFGFSEIGTVTGQAQPGNDRPRLFRLKKDRALINRFGFNNNGALKTASTLQRWQEKNLLHSIPLGINIGKTKIVDLDKAHEDYSFSFKTLWPYADYFVVNVSSPNTPNLRQLQDKSFLTDILKTLSAANGEISGASKAKPVLVKIAPDLTFEQIDDVLDVIQQTGINGIIATNTTIARENLTSDETLKNEQGGLSGKPLQKKSTEIIRHIYKITRGQLAIIGVGGIFTAEDAYEKIKAGASLVQIYTGFIYEGPSICKKINQGLVRLLERDGIRNVADAVGVKL